MADCSNSQLSTVSIASLALAVAAVRPQQVNLCQLAAQTARRQSVVAGTHRRNSNHSLPITENQVIPRSESKNETTHFCLALIRVNRDPLFKDYFAFS